MPSMMNNSSNNMHFQYLLDFFVTFTYNFLKVIQINWYNKHRKNLAWSTQHDLEIQNNLTYFSSLQKVMRDYKSCAVSYSCKQNATEINKNEWIFLNPILCFASEQFWSHSYNRFQTFVQNFYSSLFEWKRINHKQIARWQYLSRLKASAFLFEIFLLDVKKYNNLYFRLVTPSSGW